MKVTADTNVLLRAIMGDDPVQSHMAQAALDSADLVAITVPTLCELAWVLSKGYRKSRSDVAQAVRLLIGSANVVIDVPVVEAGLAVLDAGGDFADGAIAVEGQWLGADTFLSFDKQATRLIKAQGVAASLLA